MHILDGSRDCRQLDACSYNLNFALEYILGFVNGELFSQVATQQCPCQWKQAFSLPQTEMDQLQRRCREGEQDEWLSEEHIKTEYNTDGFRPPGLGLAHD